MNFRYKPFYLEFPIFQISYIILWIPIGFLISGILSALIVTVVFYVLSAILNVIYPLAFGLFVMSGRMQAMVQQSYIIAGIFFDFMFLIIGLELISCFLNKKRKEGGFDERSNDRQD